MNRVVVTGLGVISPIGQTLDRYWAGLMAGKSGLAPPVYEWAGSLNTALVGQVRDFDAAAQTVIEGAGYGAFINHRTGHGIGLAGHEYPRAARLTRTLADTRSHGSQDPAA